MPSMAVDTSILVASIASAGVVLSTAIQGSLTRSSAKRADSARDDERDQDRLRRQEDRANERDIRQEEHSAELERLNAAAEAAAEADRCSADNEVKARMQAVAAQFVGQVEKCLLFQRRGEGIGEADWGELGTMLGNVVSVFDQEVSSEAQMAVDFLCDPSRDLAQTGPRNEGQISMEIFSRAVRLAAQQPSDGKR